MIQRLMPLPVLLVLAILVGGVALFAARTAAQSGPLTLTEIVELKKLGFIEADIKAEVTRVRGSYTLSAPDLQTLRNAGFSADFVAFLQALRPQQRLTNASIIAMGQKRLPADEMLREIRNAERAFDTSPRALLALAKNHHVPAVVLRAMQGQPLSAEAVRELAGKGASGPQLLLLLDIVGVAGAGLSPEQALELSRAGVPEEIVSRLRHLPDARQAGASLGDLPHAGYYPHPLGLFTLHYPADWTLLREIRGGNVVYAVTPESGKSPFGQTGSGIDLRSYWMGLQGIEWVESNKGAIKRTLQLPGLPHTHHAGEDAAELAAIFEAILQSRQTVGRC